MECVENSVGMHLYFYLITACFLVLPKMCETTKTFMSYVGRLVWKWQDPLFMRTSAHEVNPGS